MHGEGKARGLAATVHLAVVRYGGVDGDGAEADQVEAKLRDLPGVVRRAKLLFSAGEVMVGSIGANLKGIDLGEGADDLRRALVDGAVRFDRAGRRVNVVPAEVAVAS